MAAILVIDDDSVVRHLLKEMLETAGHTVAVAMNGRDGLNSLSEAEPDLVITDIFMPEKDGFETVWEIHKDHPGIKVIAISGGGHCQNADLLSHIKRFGANAILKKPVMMADLLTTVESVLNS